MSQEAEICANEDQVNRNSEPIHNDEKSPIPKVQPEMKIGKDMTARDLLKISHKIHNGSPVPKLLGKRTLSNVVTPELRSPMLY